jgi:RimJ/RimL family protein N-acetyltransferase
MRYSLSGADPDLAATAARIARYVERTGREGIGPWAVVERASELLIGSCALTRLNEESPIEIAYRLRRDRWGVGFATEAAAAMLQRGLNDLALPRIVAYVEPTNAASLRVVAKIGMRYERDWLYDGKIPVQVFVATLS